MRYSWLIVLALPSVVHGHGFITSIRVNDQLYPGAYANDSLLASGIFGLNKLTASRQAPPDKGWSADPTLAEMACGSAGTANGPAFSIPVNGGDMLTFTLTGNVAQAWFHAPCYRVFDMANCQGNCSTVDASTLQWFRVDASTYGSRAAHEWPTETDRRMTDYRTDLTGAGPEVYLVAPTALVSGNYLIRLEVTCMWQAFEFQQRPNLAPAFPEFYPWCTQITLNSTGTSAPTGQSITSYYKYSDFQTLPPARNGSDSMNWTLPGPAVNSLAQASSPNQGIYLATSASSNFQYDGGQWAASGSQWCSSAPNASFSFAFTGTSFQYMASRGPTQGPLRITIDRDFTDDATASGTTQSPSATVYSQSNMKLQMHVITVTNNGAPTLCNDGVVVNGNLLPATRVPVLLQPIPDSAPIETPIGAPSAPESHTKKKTPIGAIAGGVVGGVAILVVLGCIIWYMRRRKPRTAAYEINETPEMDETTKYSQPTVHAYTVPTLARSPPSSPVQEEQASYASPTHSIYSHPVPTVSAPSQSGSSDFQGPASSISQRTSALSEKQQMAAVYGESIEGDLSSRPMSASTYASTAFSGPRRSLPPAPLSPAPLSSPTMHEEDAGPADLAALPPMYEDRR